ncbi:hypothetical protein SAMN02745229_03090 [Butyrivibrio fibrisolvens DSM 3071]|uniref:Uncharacterized protein n=1 Tax=Butyrivibrio fibrisolvens DSM 3071 TaxID=1121131 RepID=A0A1M6B4U1_BUTFI|nr:hypothetical protein [Butyrivibrio fibrisolvens]SHI43680.1 hypothetical protein SAMN02745229_03090 [Butyrivibrio fibrisolvens DSM 3071]
MKNRIFMDVQEVFQIANNLDCYSNSQTIMIEKYRVQIKKLIDEMEGEAKCSFDIASKHIYLETIDAIRRMQAFSKIYRFTGEERLIIDKKAAESAKVEKRTHEKRESIIGTEKQNSVDHNDIDLPFEGPISLDKFDKTWSTGKVSLESYFNSFIPKNISNDELIKWLDDMTDDFVIPQEDIDDHKKQNLKEIDKVYTSGQYIENQYMWTNVKYGEMGVGLINGDGEVIAEYKEEFDMQYNGCGIIAIINAYHSLGIDLSNEEVAELIAEFEENGCVWGGKFGTSPIAIVEYYENNTPYLVQTTTTTNSKEIEAFSKGSDTFIVEVYNNADDINEGMHYVNIEKRKDENGNITYVVHNAGEFEDKNGNGYIEDDEYIEYDSLDKAIKAVGNDDNSQPIMIIGLSDAPITDAPEKEEKTC